MTTFISRITGTQVSADSFDSLVNGLAITSQVDVLGVGDLEALGQQLFDNLQCHEVDVDLMKLNHQAW